MGSFVSRMVDTYPVRLAFIGSLLLSLIAVLGTSALGRDAAFYLNIAQRVSVEGPQVAWQVFNWPWFTYLLAASHNVTRLPMEWCAYLWCALFMAGTCALLVDAVRQRVPSAAGWACLLVLAMPAVNQFRNDILREYGFWFFCILTLWLVMHWQARGGWLRAGVIHLAIAAAMLFRMEAVMLEAALGLWLLVGLRDRRNWVSFAQFVLLPGVALVVGLSVLLAKGGLSSGRVDYYLTLISPQRVLVAFHELAGQFGDSLKFKYSRDEAGRIVFFGLLAALLIKFVALTGPFCLPFLQRSSWQALRTYLREFRPFAWAAAVYLLVLMLFFIGQQFMNGRYLSFLNLLAVPLLAVGALLFAQRFPRLGKALVVVGVLVMLANVISTGAGKPQIVEAGRWIAGNVDPQAKVYYEDARVAYYAGRGYPAIQPREREFDGTEAERFSYFAIEARADEPWLTAWLEKHQLRVLASFSNRKKATFVVIGR
ncbi:ArnT family glycosyltransferase [Pseudomonas sp. NY15463]|uniref:ArnT family glycosyltransferase n=1 Tax=Pseudomonas sp. NY15463 TaxID=3400361 RepID=UPI003A838EC8